MTKTDEILILILGACVLLWLGLALFVLMTRALHDAGQLIVRRARSIIVPDLADALAGADVDIAPLLRRLSGRTIERYAADTATPAGIAVAFARHVLSLYPETILRRAGPGARGSSSERVIALRVLSRAGCAAALPLLGQALESEDEDVRAAAVSTLGELGGGPAAELLVSALRRDAFARSRIAAQLDRFSEPISELLLPLLREQEAQLRFWGATLLSRYAGDAAIDLELAAATGDIDASVRAAAVESLAAGGGPAAIGAALALLGDAVWFVRAHAARALRAFGRADLTAAVAPLLTDEAWWVRSAAKDTLEADPDQSFQVLMGYLEHEDRFARDGAVEVMQNSGALDDLVARAVEHGSAADLDALARVLAVGGRQFAAATAVRNGADARTLVEQLSRVGS